MSDTFLPRALLGVSALLACAQCSPLREKQRPTETPPAVETTPGPATTPAPATAPPTAAERPTPGTPPAPEPRNALEQLRAAVRAAAPLPPAARGALPAWAFPGPFERHGRCVRAVAGVDPTRDRIPLRANLHLRGFGTDPCAVQDPAGGFHLWFNHPVWNGKRWPTAIFYTHTDASGLLCREPVGAVLPDGDGWQYETPNVAFDERSQQWVMLTLRYRYLAGNRTDHLSLQTAPSPRGPWRKHGAALRPELPFELPYRDRQGKVRGGLQEPSLHCVDGWWLLWYGAVRYGGGDYPSIGLAGSDDAGASWVRWPWPLVRGSGDRGAAQPDVVRDPRGGWHLYWQELRGQRHAFHHAFSDDGVTWHPHPDNPVLRTSADGWDRGRITAPSVELVRDSDGSYRHRLFYFGAERPARSGADHWIGLAVSR